MVLQDPWDLQKQSAPRADGPCMAFSAGCLWLGALAWESQQKAQRSVREEGLLLVKHGLLPKRYREKCVEVKAQPLFNDLPEPLYYSPCRGSASWQQDQLRSLLIQINKRVLHSRCLGENISFLVALQDPVRFEELLSVPLPFHYWKTGAALLCLEVLVQWAMVWERNSLSGLLKQSSAPQKVCQGWGLLPPVLLLGPDSSSVVNPVRAWVSLSASFLQRWALEGKRWADLACSRPRWRLAGPWLWWLPQLGQVCKTGLVSVAPPGDRQSSSGFRCVPSSPQTSRDLPFKSSFSTASVSFMTPGFHTALRAVKACFVLMTVFLFLQSFFYICVVF